MPTRPTIADIEDFKEQEQKPKKATTSKETWKYFERCVAKDFKTTRTPLSGMVKTITNSDTLHPKIYVECKLRGGENSFNFYEDFREARTEEGIEAYKIIDSKTGEYIYLFKSEDFFKLMENSTFDSNLIQEVKSTKKYRSVLTLFYQTQDRSEIEDKLPVVALRKKNKKGYLIGCSPNDFEALHNILKTDERHGRKKQRSRK